MYKYLYKHKHIYTNSGVLYIVKKAIIFLLMKVSMQPYFITINTHGASCMFNWLTDELTDVIYLSEIIFFMMIASIVCYLQHRTLFYCSI